MKKIKSFRKRFYRANSFLAICILCFLLASYYLNTRITLRYDSLLHAYLNIQDSYQAMDDASTYMKDFLYTGNEEAYHAYTKEYQSALDNVDALMDNEYIKENYRFQLLKNMCYSYDELCEQLYQSELAHVPYEAGYEQLQRYDKLIALTSSDYYTMITRSMQNEKAYLDVIKQVIEGLSISLLCIVLLWLIYFIYDMFHSLVKPLNQILINIKKVKEGTYDLRTISSSSLEMEQLCVALNDMAQQVEKNIENERDKARLKEALLVQENENLKKDELLIQSELKMLQNQINPHFLFNTLNMINRLVMTKQNEVASKMILNTSQLLRYGLEMQNRISTISLEINAITSYIEIQKYRVSDRIDFIMNINDEKEIGSISIPGMILQPLVENAIKHGLHDCLEDGEVEIYIAKEQEELIITVSDNGKGLPQEEMDQKLELYKKSDYNELHFGLYNVIRRLQAYYKNNVDIQVITDVNCGFSFRIAIHIEQKEALCFNY